MMGTLSKRISLHHIGGRAGNRSFPILKSFDRDFINVLYDADEDCLAQVESVNRGTEAEVHVLPYCIGDSHRTSAFNINYDPYTSSLRDLNSKYGSYYGFMADHDYVLSEAARTMEKRSVDLFSLDDLLKSKRISVPPPDFLSIDTQGSEFEILQGAKSTLRSSTLGLIVEVEFHPLYEGQKLFGDISQFLADENFSFVSFLNIGELAPYRGPLGLRAKGFQAYADALFLRNVDALDNREALPCFAMLLKLAFIAIVYNQFEYALECLRRSEGLTGTERLKKEMGDLAYVKFLEALREKVSRVPRLYPETFGSKYTHEASKGRFDITTNGETVPESQSQLKEGLRRRLPRLFSLLRGIKTGISDIKRSSADIEGVRHSEVETLLLEHGLVEQAKILMAKRVTQSPFARKT